MKKTVVFILLFFLALLAGRWGYWLGEYSSVFCSDDAVPYLMARHIQHGDSFPVFFYGQFYQGAMPCYLFALFFLLFGSSFRLIFLINLGVFAAGCVLLWRSLGLPRHTLFYFVLPLPALLFTSANLYNHFPFTFFFTCVFLWLSGRDGKTAEIVLAGLSGATAGLFFWGYQGAVVILLPFFLLWLWRRLRPWRGLLRRLTPPAAVVLVGFCLGALPFLLSELRYDFVTTRYFSTTLGLPAWSTVGHWLVHAFTVFAHPMPAPLRGPLALPLTVFLAGLTVIGLVVWLRDARRGFRPYGPALFFLLTGALIAASRFGALIAAGSPRYNSHTLLLLPFNLFFLAYGGHFLDQHVRRVFAGRCVPVFLLLPVVLAMPQNIALNRSFLHNSREITRQAEFLRSAGLPRLFFGEYLTFFTFTAVFDEQRLFLPLPVMKNDFPFTCLIKYYPYSLQAWRYARSEGFAYVGTPADAQALADWQLKRGGFTPTRVLDGAGLRVLLYPPGAAIDPLLPREYPSFYRFVQPPPAGLLQGVHIGERQVRLTYAPGAEPGSHLRGVLRGDRAEIRFPAHERAVDFSCPAAFPPGPYTLGWSNIGMALPAATVPTEETLSDPRPTFNLYSEPWRYVDELPGQGYVTVSGIPLEDRFIVRLPAGVERVAFSLHSPFDFTSGLWPSGYGQTVSERRSGARFALAHGPNRVEIAPAGDTLELQPTHVSYFKLFDGAGNIYCDPMGVMITRVEILQQGAWRDVTPLLTNPFLEARRAAPPAGRRDGAEHRGR